MNFDEICKRAGGRRRYQAQRRRSQRKRQLLILAELLRLKWQWRGEGSRLAQAHRVHKAQISRDIHYLQRFRNRLIKRDGEQTANQIMHWLVAIQAHPRDGFTVVETFSNGVYQLRVTGNATLENLRKPQISQHDALL